MQTLSCGGCLAKMWPILVLEICSAFIILEREDEMDLERLNTLSSTQGKTAPKSSRGESLSLYTPIPNPTPRREIPQLS